MDMAYTEQILERLIAARAVHDEKFAGQEAHLHCLPRFDKAISGLRSELGYPSTRLDFSVSESALPDAIDEARCLEATARLMADECQTEAASLMMARAREVIAKEMNELDGFDR